MKRTLLFTALAALILPACETHTQTGALAGAAVGYGIRGDARGAALGAGIGLAAGAIADAAVGQPYRGSAPTGYNIRVAQQVPGHPGFVYSPYRRNAVVDVRRVRSGAQVQCPFTNRIFIRP